MVDVTAQKDVASGANVSLTEGGQILLSREKRGRLVQIQMGNV